jgi:chromosome segregation ATPase
MRQLLKEEARSLALEADVSMKKLKDELKSVKFELEKAEADTSDARRRNQDLKDQCEAAEADAYEVRQTVEDLTEQCEAAKLAAGAARNAADEANKAAFEANKQVKLLKAELALAAKSGSAGSAEKVKKLEDELESKEARIKKLEAVRLTKEQCAALKKMKEERLQYMSEVKALKSQNESLKKSIAAGSQDFSVHEANSAEIRALKDANETLSEKLRKYAAHCQRLEGEKVAAAASLQSSECADAVSLLAAGDFSGSIAAMCERLGAAEEECAALASAETRANAYLTQLDRAKEEGARLEQDKAVALERVARLMKLEQERAEQLNDAEDRVATLLQEKQELLAKNNSAVSKNVEVESEKARQVRFLEQENLQLMMEAKNVKKKLQTVQAEFDAFRMASKEMRSPLRGLDRNGGGTPSKNNSGTPTKISMSAVKQAGAGTSTKKVGLGERAEDENFDATSECKQS